MCNSSVYKMGVKASDVSISTGLNWSRSLKTHKAKGAYLKQHDTPVGVGQVTKCIFVTSLFGGIVHSVTVA